MAAVPTAVQAVHVATQAMEFEAAPVEAAELGPAEVGPAEAAELGPATRQGRH